MHRIPTILLALAAAAFLAGCAHPHYDRVVQRGHGVHHPGPPPHAPAHGYRYKHQGVALVFQQELDCYAVVGHSGTYWRDGSFFRLGSGGWEISTRWGSSWISVGDHRIPYKVRHKHGKGHARGKGHKGGHPAKRH